MEEILQCVVCLTVPPPPWFTCLNGHALCDPCYAKIDTVENPDDSDDEITLCPICRVKLDYSRQDQALAAALVEQFHPEFCVTCPNEGCDQQVPIGAMEAHKSVCDCRRVLCPLKRMGDCDCNSECVALEREAHVRANACHFRLVEKSPATWTKTDDATKPLFFMAEGVCVQKCPDPPVLRFYSFTEEEPVVAVDVSVEDGPFQLSAVLPLFSLCRRSKDGREFEGTVVAVPGLATVSLSIAVRVLPPPTTKRTTDDDANSEREAKRVCIRPFITSQHLSLSQ